MNSRGDTIIEVMFSFVIFSLLTVGTYVVMNRGTQISQRSLEITLVRQQLDAQVSLVRYIKDTSPAQWSELTSGKFLVANPIDVAGVSVDGCPTPGGRTDLNAGTNTFFMAVDKRNNTVQPVRVSNASYSVPAVYAKVDLANSKAYGIFAQIVRAEQNSGANTGKAYDVYISACWDSVGSRVPVSIGTVTRLYDK